MSGLVFQAGGMAVVDGLRLSQGLRLGVGLGASLALLGLAVRYGPALTNALWSSSQRSVAASASSSEEADHKDFSLDKPTLRSRLDPALGPAPPASFHDIDLMLEKLWAGEIPKDLAEVLSILKYPDIYSHFGSNMPKGIILHGDPGTGKTYFAKVLASVTESSFFYAAASEFDEIYVGRGAQRVRALFDQAARAAKEMAAQELAQQQEEEAKLPSGPSWGHWFGAPAKSPAPSDPDDPDAEIYEDPDADFPSASSTAPQPRPLGRHLSIIFIDEIDALGTRGSTMSTSDSGHATLSQLLASMDGMTSDANILVIAATNNIKLVDPALVRSGRFDRIVRLPRPSQQSRLEMLQFYLNGKPGLEDLTESGLLDVLAEAMEGFNCSDIKNMVNEASIAAARQVAENRRVAERERQGRGKRAGARSPPLGLGDFKVEQAHLLEAFKYLYNKIRSERSDRNDLKHRNEVLALLAKFKGPASPALLSHPTNL